MAILQNYQKTFERGTITVPRDGIIAFFVLADGLLKNIRVHLDEGNPMGYSSWQVVREDVELASFTIPQDDVTFSLEDVDITVNRFDLLLLNLTDLTGIGGQIRSPIAIQYEVEEDTLTPIHWDSILEKPATFPPDPHTHDDRYYTETETDSQHSGILSTAATDATTKANAAQAAAATDATTKANAAQAFAIQRTNHTGSQAQATISGLVGDLAARELTTNKGTASGYAPLDSGSKVPAAYLPAYVDDVLEYANLAAFPVTGTTSIIYVAIDTNKTYRWSGSAYVEISPSPGSTDSVTEGSTNLYFTQARVRTTPLTGYAASGSRIALAAADTVLGAFNKIGKWLNDLGSMAFQNSNAVSISGGTESNVEHTTDTFIFPTFSTNQSITPHVEDALGATVNDANFGLQGMWILSGSGDVTLTGMNNSGVANGQAKIIRNGSPTFRLIILHNSALSTTNKRFYINGRADPIYLAPGQEITARYDTTLNRWIVAYSPMDYWRIGGKDGKTANARDFTFGISEVSLTAGASNLFSLVVGGERFIPLEVIYEARAGDISAILEDASWFLNDSETGAYIFSNANDFRTQLDAAHKIARQSVENLSFGGTVSLDMEETAATDINVYVRGLLIDIQNMDA